MTDKEIYESALRNKVQIEDYLNQKRCFDCDNLDKLAGNVCKFNGGVPDDYLYATNECGDFHYLIPF